MFTYPNITAAVAAERRRDLLARADAYRLARVTDRRPRGIRSLAIAHRLARIMQRPAATPATSARIA